MKIFYIVVLTALAISFVVLVVYLVDTLKRIKRTAEAFEMTAKKINQQLDNISEVGSKLGSVFSSVSPVLLSLLSLAVNVSTYVLKGLLSIGRKKKQ